MAKSTIKLKQVPVYLPEAKHIALQNISANKRTSMTKLIEAEIDKLIKREDNNNA